MAIYRLTSAQIRTFLLCGFCVLLVAGVSQAKGQEASDQRRQIEQHVALGKTLLAFGDYAAAQTEFQAVLQLDRAHREAKRLLAQAQRRLHPSPRASEQQARERLRHEAQDLAIKFAREKAQARAHQETKARQQVARAREQQLKFLYAKGLSLYQQGAFQAAIETFQQMVLIDPKHPLVQAAQRLIVQAETKLAQSRARALAKAQPGRGAAAISELEQQLTAKRIEIETVLKYAKIAMKERNHSMALELVQRVLTQDPTNREAQQLSERVQLAKLKEEEARAEAQVQLDDQQMVNDVLKAQVLPEPKPVQAVSPTSAVSGMPPPVAGKLQQPISFAFDEVPLSDVLDFLADVANVSIIPSPRLDLKAKKVSMHVTDLPLEQALKYLAKSLSLSYRVEPDAILIATEEEFSSEPMETRVFFLRHGLGPLTLETSAVTPNPALTMESMKNLIEKAIPQPSGSKLVVDERSGGLVITNTGENLARVEQLLSQLDTIPVQVLIEARFLEVTMSDLEELGVESILTGDYTLTKEAGLGGSPGPGHIIGKNSGFKFPALSRETEGANFTLEGVLTSFQFESVLHLLEESKKSKTLSAPRVTALNNQTATIKVVDEFNYPTRYEVSLVQFDINGDGDFNDAGETEFANVPKDFQKRDVGILLHVTPSVGKDLKTVTLVLAPEVSQFSQFRDLGGGVSVPEFTSSALTTSVVIEGGQTVVLGGLMKDTTSEQVMKVPVLGDLPLVGALFRQKEETSTRKNLLIFITARILAPRGQTT